MGSMQDIKIISRKGEVLPLSVIQGLKEKVGCEVVVKCEANESVYRNAIDRYNKAWIAEAGIVVFCKTEADISACLVWIRKYDVEMTISCGRHSYYGASSTDGGLVIDLCEMKSVTIDAENMTITAGGGCQAVDLEIPLQALGLSVVMGAANDTGIGGLTLGGGSGVLTGQYGLVVDNLLAARIVLANGDVVSASEKENAELFWAIRGAGSNFGIVSEFVYKVHEQEDVFFGPLVFTPEKVRPLFELAPQLQTIVESDEAAGKLVIFFAFLKGPGMPAVHPIVLVFYDGPSDVAKSLVAPLWELGPVADMTTTMPYLTVNTPTALTLGPTTHQHYATNYVPLFDLGETNLLVSAVNDLGSFLEKFGPAVAPSKIVIEIRSHKKSGSVEPSAMALRARVPALMMVFEAQHDGSVPDSNAIMRKELKDIMGKLLSEVLTKHPENGKFFNANISSGTEKARDMFGENWGKLRELKRKYDPEYIFSRWYPIPPADT